MSLLLGLTLAVGAVLAAPAARGATTFVVNTTDTDSDAQGCEPAPGDCTLREAVEAVNAGQGKTIRFDPDVFPRHLYDLISGYGIDIPDASGVTIDGTGAGVILSGAGALETSPISLSSPPGEPLAGVTIKNIGMDGWEEPLWISAGGSGDTPVSKLTLAGVVVENTAINVGIRVKGSAITQSVIRDTVVSRPDDEGIALLSDGPITKVSLLNVTVAASEEDPGIVLEAGGDVSGLKILGCSVRNNAGTGIQIQGDRILSSILAENTLRANDGRGIDVQAVDSIAKLTIRDNRFARNTDAALQMYADSGLSQVRVEKNTVADNGRGIRINGQLSKSRLAENRVIANDSDGISVQIIAGQQVQISKNQVADNLENGVYLFGCTAKCRIDGNDVAANDQDGINLAEVDGAQVSKNTARGNGGAGIRALDFDGIRITGNRTIGNFSAGIRIDGDGGRVEKNFSRGLNAESHELEDETLNCGTNVWKKNDFRISNEACIQ